GYKQKRPDPWETADEKYPPGKRITGRITSLPDYGIFVEIEDGLEGRIHVTEVDWTEKIKKPSKYFSIGDTVDAVVLKVDKAERKISLSIKQLKPSPWEEIGQKYKIGQQVTGRVRSFTDFGAFVGLEEGADALLHISDMSWTKHIKHPSELCRKGQKIDAVVLSIEPEKGRMALGLKQLTPDPWIEEIPNKFKPGDKINGKIIKITDFGLFMELEGGVEGLIYSSEIEKDGKTLHEKLEEHFKIGDEITAKIIRVDTAERKIGLSMKMHSV
ncbi:MAG TPA: 30S ribosomal protein S1, partial [Nitrospiraceae bacterium]|nr:30S ribosomal protein S1 [Nitrospiraceae bacterium]